MIIRERSIRGEKKKYEVLEHKWLWLRKWDSASSDNDSNNRSFVKVDIVYVDNYQFDVVFLFKNC